MYKFAVGALATGLTLFGVGAVSARRLVVDELIVPVSGAGELDGLRILHISDTHVSEEGDWVIQMIRSLSNVVVDLIVATGDVISSAAGLPAAAGAIGSLKSGLGTYVVPGNHDHWTGGHLDRISGNIGGFISPRYYANEFSKYGVEILVNESVVIPWGNGEADLVGLDDPFLGLSDVESAYDGLKGDRPKIVLGHSPDGVELLQSSRCDLYLCGHTHGGQILGPLGLPPRQTNTAYPLPSP